MLLELEKKTCRVDVMKSSNAKKYIKIYLKNNK